MSSSFPSEQRLPFDLGSIVPSQLSRKIKWAAVVIGLVVAYVLLSYLRSVYTDWLWYGQLGLTSVFIKVLVTRLTLFVVGAVLFAIPAAASVYFARRLSQGPEQIPVPQDIRNILNKLIGLGAILAVTVLSLVFGAIAAGQWELFLRFSNAANFGITEPVFGQDIAFYVFSLPLYEFVHTWLLRATVAILSATLGMYFVNFSFRGVGFQFTLALRVQISIILALIMVIVGAGHWLDRWSLLLSTDGSIFGAAYTDVHSRKPALMILTFFAVASSILMLVNAYFRGIRLLIGGVALWAIMALLLGVLWPNAVQRFTVEPQEYTKEQDYIARNIEFTRRAFEAGKLDLTEAEGVADIIEAETDAQKAQALRQLSGGLTEQYDRWRAELTGILALIEVVVDFPDEDDAPEETTAPVLRKLNNLIGDIEAALGDRGIGEKIRDGFRIAIIGAPNAGKSTLLNRLAGREAAIVTSRPGTTRDVIEIRRVMGGQVVWISDTAGLRETDDEIEAEGVRRAERVASEADLRVFMVDGSAPDLSVLSSPYRLPTDIVVVNKADIDMAANLPAYDYKISAKQGEGVPALETALSEFISGKASSVEAPVITRARHRVRPDLRSTSAA